MSACTEWAGVRDRDGYGRVMRDGWQQMAHRLAWADAHGPIPVGLFVLHSCDNPPCVNVEHLSVGTNTDNMRDMAAKGRGKEQGKTHCVNGHEFTPENTYQWGSGAGRMCRACRRLRNREASRQRTLRRRELQSG